MLSELRFVYHVVLRRHIPEIMHTKAGNNYRASSLCDAPLKRVG